MEIHLCLTDTYIYRANRNTLIHFSSNGGKAGGVDGIHKQAVDASLNQVLHISNLRLHIVIRRGGNQFDTFFSGGNFRSKTSGNAVGNPGPTAGVTDNQLLTGILTNFG